MILLYVALVIGHILSSLSIFFSSPLLAYFHENDDRDVGREEQLQSVADNVLHAGADSPNSTMKRWSLSTNSMNSTGTSSSPSPSLSVDERYDVATCILCYSYSYIIVNVIMFVVAVISALRSLQEKIKRLESERELYQQNCKQLEREAQSIRDDREKQRQLLLQQEQQRLREQEELQRREQVFSFL